MIDRLFEIFHSMLDKQNILFVAPNLLKGFSVRGAEIEERISLSWAPDRIEQVLGTVRAATGRTIRLLVGEPFAYVTTLRLSRTEILGLSPKEDRERIRQLAGRYVPEDMNLVPWDYRDVVFSSQNNSDRFVQVVAIAASFSNVLSPSLRKSGFRVVAVESESCAVARLFSNRKEPIILVYRGETLFVAGIAEGIVLSSMTALVSVNNSILEEVSRFLDEHLALKPGKIIFAGMSSESDFPDFDRESALRAGYEVEYVEASAILGIAEKKDLTGDDRSVLSLDLAPRVPEPTKTEQSDPDIFGDSTERFRLHTLDERSLSRESSSKESRMRRIPKRTLFLGVSFLIFLILGGGSILFMKREQAKEERLRVQQNSENIQRVVPEKVPASGNTPEETTEILENLPAVQETPPVFNRASFRISIENGSGVSGAAGNMEKKLTAEGFSVLSVGNAVTILDQTLLRTKATVPPAFLEEFFRAAGMPDSFEQRPDILEDDERDVILSIGKDFSSFLR